jgi:bacteriocin-like protein
MERAVTNTTKTTTNNNTSRELTNDELNAVSGGTEAQENKQQLEALNEFRQVLQRAGQV